MNRPLPPVSEDSRGIIDPGRLQERVALERYAPGPALAGLVDCFWVVSYALPAGLLHVQRILPHPCVNLSVAHGQARGPGRPSPLQATVTGVPKSLYERRITGTGWAVAARSTPGGFGALVTGRVADLTGRVLPLGRVLPVQDGDLVSAVASVEGRRAQVDVLEATLTGLLEAADPARVRTAREVAEVGEQARSDRSMRRLDDLVAAAGIGSRTLQRLFGEYVGVSPTWVLRRYRLLEAAEIVRDGRSVLWAEVAADLGYSDQAHLVRDFRAVVGTTPAAYAAQQHGPQPSA